MNRITAALSFLGICLILAALLLFHIITSTISGVIFALALILFGSVSKGFRTVKVTKENKNDGAA